MNRCPSVEAFNASLTALPEADREARDAAAARQGQLTKPPGSLGRLEEIAIFLAGWQGCEKPAIERGRAVVFAGNHGVVARGVSAFPAEVTAQMVANFRNGGAAINALAGAAGLTLDVVPLSLDRPTADFTQAPAMEAQECLAALNAGAAAIADADLLVLGEMGIGNTTSAAALALASYGGTAADWVGPGTGVDAEGIRRKIDTVEAGLALHRDSLTTPFEILRRLGGREIAAISGAVLAARMARVPVVLDGFIATSAIAPLTVRNPAITAHCIAGHCSAEPGHRRLLSALGLTPLLSLDMRLGEGSGAAVAVQIIRAALAAHGGMATFAEAGVSGG
ncbi:nicotinate-nucleotide--dimethylbenzimidazole phosphoribosyltransferase [Stakelama pacifica]|uniref:Nicotinate-nucleotide--dimethylbenzimidazole phosphoribosyltransferase n=1 Tax=Stakelama pacifica TaxID=517720 RepID=A0A4R6FRX7_9SPHN|nr:nicotinate-nucleotide--dimethylbenzimidazole phosphoribosyltransferase [Stakelama pacifica]TDN84501.1 nicotinate-nucleotide-dimethylbenzimidazole phosphoribosyltransferase [Stakelama pacifica]GGO93625.1 nicotinate-nucleotide--dimethylbenzimidazole phosphoribosyltransferase [Stakelama pacifica]